MATKTTRDWLDLYDMMLDRGLEFAKDPHAGALKRGITQAELDAQGGQMPAKMSMDAYYAMRNSWKRVRTSMQIFGLELGDDLEIEPGIILETSTPAFAQWMRSPWVEISRGAEKPLRFEGRDAITAVGFLNMYIQQMEQPCTPTLMTIPKKNYKNWKWSYLETKWEQVVYKFRLLFLRNKD
jgi:hypothetical protein